MFQHANVRTPRWLGYLVQRPEMPLLAPRARRAPYNYADLPFLDMLFGTFRNPADFAPQTGFYEGASQRMLEMAACRDVSRPVATGSDGLTAS